MHIFQHRHDSSYFQCSSRQEAQSEIQELCEEHTWLVDVYLFLGRWSGASLEHVKGQRAAPCEEDMKKVHQWAERIHTVPSSISTSSQLFIINCNSLKEDLGVCALHEDDPYS